MPIVNLVPLGLGELLDQTFSNFRKHFWLFAGILAIPQGVMVALNIVIQVLVRPVMFVANTRQTPQAATEAATSAMRAGFAVWIPYAVLYTLALGATTHAISEIYLGRTTTIRESYRAVRRKIRRIFNVFLSVALRTTGIFFLLFMALGMVLASMGALFRFAPWIAIAMALIGVLAMLVGAVLVLVFVLRYSVAIPAVVLEDISARQALRRSTKLTQGHLWRLLVVAFVMIMINLTIVSLCQAPFTVAAMLIAVKTGQAALWLTIPGLLLGGAASVATAPLIMISFAIAYYDLRVRKEGFDLQLMIAQLEESTPTTASLSRHPIQLEGLQDGSVLAMFIFTLIVGGIYQPIWFLRRRSALNNLNSGEKLGIAGLLIALAGFVSNIGIAFSNGYRHGFAAEIESKFDPLNIALMLISQIIIIVYCFRVRQILMDHLAPPEDGMFTASARLQNPEQFSPLATFVLGIFYLQHKINNLLDDAIATGNPISFPSADSLPPPTIS